MINVIHLSLYLTLSCSLARLRSFALFFVFCNLLHVRTISVGTIDIFIAMTMMYAARERWTQKTFRWKRTDNKLLCVTEIELLIGLIL